MRRLPVLAAALALVLAACAGEDTTNTSDPEPTSTTATSTTTSTSSTTSTTTAPTTTTTSTPTTTTTASQGVELDATCTSPDGFSVAYPDDWETNDGEVVAECTMFDPNAFTVPDGTDERVAAISVYLENAPYSTLTSSFDSEEVEDREEVTIDGHNALRVERATSGDGLFPEGTLITSYFIDLESDQRSLVANTIDLSTIDYREATRVLDRMVDTLDLDEPVMSGVQPVGDFATTPIESPEYPASGEPAWLTDVRFGTHDGFDRVVFEFDSAADFSYSMEYVEQAIPASGDPIDIDGEVILGVTMQPASGVDLTGEEAVETYTGSDRIDVAGSQVVELVEVEDFESVLTWAIGLEDRTDVAVDTLDDPHRLVVDIATG